MWQKSDVQQQKKQELPGKIRKENLIETKLGQQYHIISWFCGEIVIAFHVVVLSWIESIQYRVQRK